MGKRGAVFVGVLLVVCGLGYWAWLDDGPDNSHSEHEAWAAPHQTADGIPADLADSDGYRVRTEPYEPPESSPREERRVRSTETAIAGRCVDWQGEPLPKVAIRSLSRRNNPKLGSGVVGQVLGASGKDGKFFVVISASEMPSPLSLDFEFTNEDHSQLFLRPASPYSYEVGKIKQLGDVAIGGGEYGAVEGRVTESASGEGVGKVDIFLYPRGIGRPLALKTNSEGRYLVRGLGLSGDMAPEFMAQADLSSAQPTIKTKWPDLIAVGVEPHENDFVARPGEVAEANFDILVTPPPLMVKRLEINFEDVAGKDWRLLNKSGQVITFGGTILKGGVVGLNKEASFYEDQQPMTLELRGASVKSVVKLSARLQHDVIKGGPDHQIIPTATLSGKVFDSGPNLVPGVTIVINRCKLTQPTGMHYASLKANEFGEYQVELEPGDYWVSAKRDAGRLQAPGKARLLRLPVGGATEDLTVEGR